MKYLLTLFVVFCSTLSIASQGVHLFPLPHQDRLPSASIRFIYQDRDGYLWLATDNGLCMTDGYDTRVFRTDTQTGKNIRNNRITHITEDHRSRIWVSTVKGAFVVDRKNGYKVYTPDTLLAGRTVAEVQVLRNGCVLVALYGKLLLYDVNDHLLSVHPVDVAGNNYIHHIVEARDGTVYLLFWKAGVCRYDVSSGKIYSYPPPYDDLNCSHLVQDFDKPYFWLNSQHHGIVRFNPAATSAQERYVEQRASHLQGAREASYNCLNVDPVRGNLWASSQSKLHCFRSTSKGELQPLPFLPFSEPFNRGLLLENISLMRNGNLAIASMDGESFIVNFKKTPNKIYLLENFQATTGTKPALASLCEGSQGFYYLLQDQEGLLGYDAVKQELVTKVSSAPGIPLKEWTFGKLYPSRILKGGVWCSDRFGPYVFGLQRTEHGLLIDRCVRFGDGREPHLAEDAKGNLYVSTEKELYYYEVAPGIKHLLRTDFQGTEAMKLDEKGGLWVNKPLQGIYWLPNPLHSKLNKFFPLAADTVVVDIVPQAGGIYFCTEDGRLFFMTAAGKKTDLTNRFGGDNSTFYSILADARGHIWLFSDQRIIEYMPKEQRSKEYRTSDYDIPIFRFFPKSVSQTRDGRILVGGYNGFGVFQSSSTHVTESNVERVKITDVVANGVSLMFGGNSDICSFESVELSADQSDIEIHLSTLDMLRASQIRFAYRMKGTREWQLLPIGKNLIHLHLGKGQYILQVKENDRSEHTLTEYTLTRRPAWFETGWFYLAAILGIAFLVYWGARKYREKVQLRSQKELEANLIETKLNYFANISHDLLTPLTIISCATESIDVASKRQQENVSIIRSNLMRLKHLLQQVLDFRKMESGKMQLNIGYGDLSAFVEQIALRFSPLLEKQQLEFKYTSEGLIVGCFDGDKIEKVLSNLLSNAIKYTPQGRVWVRLYQTVEADRSFAHLEVGDTGIGVATSQQQQVFTPFYNNPQAKAGTSNGIGLSLCRQIITLHKGTIFLQSKEGRGSIFTVSFPIDRNTYRQGEESVPLESEESVSVDAEKAAEAQCGSQAGLLIVEDDKELQMLIKQFFEREYQIYTADNGVEGMEIVKALDIDLIISDVVMPKMDGLTLCRQLKNDLQTSHIPILLLTAKVQTEDRIICYDAGANAYIAKPFELSVLKARIENLLKQHQKNIEDFKASPLFDFKQLEAGSLDETFLTRLVQSIEQHLSDADYDINVLASDVFVSRSTLSRKIKVLTGQTAIDFVLNTRMKYACKMLAESNQPIAEIAFKVGFSDGKYFARRFKEVFGVSPSAYRKRG